MSFKNDSYLSTKLQCMSNKILISKIFFLGLQNELKFQKVFNSKSLKVNRICFSISLPIKLW